MASQADSSGHSAACLRLMHLFPRVARGMRRSQDLAAPSEVSSLTPRHVAALEHLRDGPISVGVLAQQLGLTLPTVSGMLSDLERAGIVVREADEHDRRRTIAKVTPGQESQVRQWLDGAAQPLARVLDQLDSAEQAAFVKAMNLLAVELRTSDEP